MEIRDQNIHLDLKNQIFILPIEISNITNNSYFQFARAFLSLLFVFISELDCYNKYAFYNEKNLFQWVILSKFTDKSILSVFRPP